MPKPLDRRLRNREYDERRKNTPGRELHSSYAWIKASKAYRQANQLCVMCSRTGLVEPARVVDHIVPHKGDPALFWDHNNWQSLCFRHHNSDKKIIERGGKPRPQIDADGWPVE